MKAPAARVKSEVWVVTFFRNPGWGSRGDNYNRLVGVDTYNSPAKALKAGKDFVGDSVRPRRFDHQTILDGSHVTTKQINDALKAAGIDAEIVRGDGYFYFTGSAMDLAHEQGVYGVARLSDLSVERWVEEARGKIV